MSRRTRRVSLHVLVSGLVVVVAATAAAFDAELDKLAGELVPPIEGAAIGKIAVVDFMDLEGNVTHLGRFLAEETSNALMKQKSGLVVIDRNHLGQILKEQKLSATGLVNEAEARQVGRIAGVQAFVIGTLTPLGDEVRLSVKVIHTDSARMVTSGAAAIARVGTIDKLLAQGLGNTHAASTASSKSAASPAPAQDPSQVQRRFAFELKRCELSGQTVECFLLIRNDGSERLLTLAKESKLYDDFGNNYTPSRAELANQTQTFERYGQGHVSNTLIYSVPVRAAISFEDISPQATQISSLKLKFGVEQEGWFWVTFVNIPLVARTTTDIQMIAGAPQGGGPAAGGMVVQQQPRTIEEAVDAELTDLAGEAVRRAGQSILRMFRKKPGPQQRDADDGEEEAPDGG